MVAVGLLFTRCLPDLLADFLVLCGVWCVLCVVSVACAVWSVWSVVCVVCVVCGLCLVCGLWCILPGLRPGSGFGCRQSDTT